MCLLVFLVLSVLLQAQTCEGKPAKQNGYPEENRNVHSPYSQYLFEGDMLVEPDVKKIALAGGDVAVPASRKRGAMKLGGPHRIWPNGVVHYVIDPSLDAHKIRIESAMRDWENGTCVQFVPRTSENVYVKITSFDFLGCIARVGYKDISNFPPSNLPFISLLNLGSGCYDTRVIRHELGHSLGFYHEQSRPDRDNYVKIMWENVMAGKENQFGKYPNTLIDSLGVDYDLYSVMHYNSNQFSKNNKDTIVSLDPNKILAVNENISAKDKEQLKKLYNCV